MSKLLIACSGFKDVLSSELLCESLQDSFKILDSSLEISILPLSDGGEGFLSSWSFAFPNPQFSIHTLEVIGPLGLPITGEYGILHSFPNPIGIIELAKVSGIEYVSPLLRNPYNTTSHGVGQTIKHLYDSGIKEIYLGLGGSSTTDGGLSTLYALSALDFEFSIPAPLFLTGSDLNKIVSVSPNSSSLLNELKITIACDVNNPMLGLNGSAYVFGPQKGINPDMMEKYEELMIRVCSILNSIKGKNVAYEPHSGAAGGIAGGIMACFENCTVKRGVDIISDALGLEEKINKADFVITGEGCYDLQTSGGKVVSKVKQLRNDAIIVCGINKSLDRAKIYDLNQRFGNLSFTHVKECLKMIASEIYEKEIKKVW